MKIKNIKQDVSFKSNSNWYEGYIVELDDCTYKFGISSSQHCCEEWGYMSSNDDLSEFIGGELLNVYVTDTELTNYDLPRTDSTFTCPNTMFITFETDNGKFQFVCYNSHNGYYGHDCIFIKDQQVIESNML